MHGTLIAIAAIWIGSSVAAAPKTYFCEIKSYSRNGWIPESGAYAIDENTKSVIVFDKFVRYANKTALAADVTQFGPPVYKFRWQLRLPTKRQLTINARYTVRLDARKNKMTIEAFVGDDRSHRGSGTCKVTQK